MDLTPVIDGPGPARLLDMAPGRSGKVVDAWLGKQDPNFRRRIQVVSLDGFAGYHAAAARSLSQARTVMDPFHVVHLAAGKLTVCRQRIQQHTQGHRGRSGDPLYGIRRILLTRMDLLTDKQARRLGAMLADERHEPIEAFYLAYQDLIDAYGNPDRRAGKIAMIKTFKAIRTGVPKWLSELASLRRSLWKRRREILAYFDVGVSNGAVEAINGRLEHLRGIALGFRNLDHYILRSINHSGQIQTTVQAL